MRQQEAYVKIAVGDITMHQATVYLKATDKGSTDVPETVILEQQWQQCMGTRNMVQSMMEEEEEESNLINLQVLKSLIKHRKPRLSIQRYELALLNSRRR